MGRDPYSLDPLVSDHVPLRYVRARNRFKVNVHLIYLQRKNTSMTYLFWDILSIQSKICIRKSLQEEQVWIQSTASFFLRMTMTHHLIHQI